MGHRQQIPSLIAKHTKDMSRESVTSISGFNFPSTIKDQASGYLEQRAPQKGTYPRYHKIKTTNFSFLLLSSLL